MVADSSSQLEGLSALIMQAPSWRRSVLLLLLLGGAIEAMLILGGIRQSELVAYAGILVFTVPALFAAFVTGPLVRRSGNDITLDWSALIALGSCIVTILITFSPVLLLATNYIILFFAASMGIVFFLRILLLGAIVDHHLRHILVPALTQTAVASLFGYLLLGHEFALFVIPLHLFFGLAAWAFIWILERPMKQALGLSPLGFANAFMAHMIYGSTALEDFFRQMGDGVTVIFGTLLFRREGRDAMTVTAPNLHPGPLGEIGGSALPRLLTESLKGHALVFHGMATHDFNPVAASEVETIADSIRDAQQGTLDWHATATHARRYQAGSVSVLAQAFGDTIFIAATRSPDITDDVEYAVGLAIIEEGKQWFRHVVLADTHNSFIDLPPPVLLGSRIGEDYREAAALACEALSGEQQYPYTIGFSQLAVPFTHEEGFGDLGVMAMVITVEDKETIWLVFDGNNLHVGIREELRDLFLLECAECEISTSDTHVVNMASGKNPVGWKVPLPLFLPFVREAVDSAREDAAPAESAGGTAHCADVVVFGSQRITQLAGIVTGSVGIVWPVALIITLFAFLSTGVVYLILI
jgi:putative membrane protein